MMLLACVTLYDHDSDNDVATVVYFRIASWNYYLPPTEHNMRKTIVMILARVALIPVE